jgi:hypothetical protein
MVATYSQSVAGLNQTMFEPETLTVNDAQAVVGAQQRAMRNGLAFLCLGPDGAQHWYTIDAERSIPGQPPILRRGVRLS